MKSQLLEDIGDSQPAPPRKRSSAAPPPQAAPDPAVRPRVWRSRHPAPVAEPAPEFHPPPPAEAPTEPHFFEPPPGTPSFASQQPDLSIQFPDEPVHWMDRWGRKFFGWTIAAALVAGVLGTGWWIYGDTQVESTLAMVADQTPTAAPAAPPAAEPTAPAVEPAPATATTDLAVPEPAPAAPAPIETREPSTPDAATVAAAAAAPIVAAAPKPKKKAAAPAVRRNAGKRTPVRTVARREPPPARVVLPPPPPRPEPEPAGDALAETLRQCRAAGYHATLCIKRGCTATKFGLACRG
ncbi:hypothetical protein [Massilia sp. ZL223]|uniref:hypothetical protein n=1 Tax=Massilia sp. ZL223 TaxID=2824904 RepID=UPI001B8364EC|nr:hypothetical protein [Massilia sp. ZL223]MBQ5964754.1 hypothetical protein [Massilia sp. ZL223]